MAFFQAETLWVKQHSDGALALVVDLPGRPVNTCTQQFLTDLEAALERVAADERFGLLIINSSKPGSFLAGADVHELAAVQSPAEAMRFAERGQQLFSRVSALRMPTVAIISGACLGGGLELALACDYRVVVDDPKTQLGFPEVELGIIPAWGGTQRLPCAVGLERALQMILGARRVSAKEAVAWGLADALVNADQQGFPGALGEPQKRPLARLPKRTWRQRFLESTRLGRWLVFRGAERVLQRRLPDDLPAPWEALAAIRAGIEGGREAGLTFECEAIGRLAESPASRHLVQLFLQREQIRRSGLNGGAGVPPVAGRRDACPTGILDPAKAIRRVGIVGAGVMGAGIAELAVLKGCEVVVREANETALGFGLFRLMGLLNHAVERGLLRPADLKAKLAAVNGTTAWRGFADLDLVIEVIPEDLDAKKAVFRDMEKNTSPSTLLVTNTSSLRVEVLARDLQYPGRVAGLHFFNPVHKVPLVEVVRAPPTKADVLARLQAWVVQLGKWPIVVNDSPGFLVNRVLMPYLNEAVLLVSEGRRIAQVDEAMRRFGMPVGPLQLLDQIGLDVAADVARAIESLFGDRIRISPGFGRMKEKGWLGQKSELGFYRYRRGQAKAHEAARLLLLEATTFAATTPAEEMAAARERMVGLMVNEAAQCLAERVVESAELLDLAMVLGTGWAPHRGGPLSYAADRGYADIVASLSALATVHGPRFEPCAELRRLAADHN